MRILRLIGRVVRGVLSTRKTVVASGDGRFGLVVLDADVGGEGAAGEEDLVRASEFGERARGGGDDGARAVLWSKRQGK